MLDIIGGLLTGVLKFYAWTVGLGLVALFLIMLIEEPSISFAMLGTGPARDRYSRGIEPNVTGP